MIVAFFTARSCLPCAEAEKAWRKFKKMHKGEMAFLEFRLASDTKRIFRKLGISWVPTVVFYSDDGREIKRVEGSFTADDLEKVIMKRFFPTYLK